MGASVTAGFRPMATVDKVDHGASDRRPRRIGDRDCDTQVGIGRPAGNRGGQVGFRGFADQDGKRALDSRGKLHAVDFRQDSAWVDRQRLVEAAADPEGLDAVDGDLGRLRAVGGEAEPAAAGQPFGAVDMPDHQLAAVRHLVGKAAPDPAVPIFPDDGDFGIARLRQIDIDVERHPAGERQQPVVGQVKDMRNVFEVRTVQDPKARLRLMLGGVVGVLVASRPKASHFDQPGGAEPNDTFGFKHDLIARLGRWRRRHLCTGRKSDGGRIVAELEDDRRPGRLGRGALDPHHREERQLVLLRCLIQAIDDRLHEQGMGLDQRGAGTRIGRQPRLDEARPTGDKRRDDVGATAPVQQQR